MCPRARDDAKKSSSPPVDQVLIEGNRVFHHLLLGGPGGQALPQNDVPATEFAKLLAQKYAGQGPFSIGIVPDGMNIRDIFQDRGIYVFLIQVDPGVRTLRWLRDDSLADYGEEATYREVTIGLPYVYFFVAITAQGVVSPLNSVYFRKAPLSSLNDRLQECAFYNCSVDSYNVHCWICAQSLSLSLKRGQSLAELANQFVHWFWGSGFNASSEHNEGQSFWGRTQQEITDDRLQSIQSWEEATRQDSGFACEVPWLEANLTPRQVYKQLVTVGQKWNPVNSKPFAALVSMIAKQRARKEA